MCALVRALGGDGINIGLAQAIWERHDPAVNVFFRAILGREIFVHERGPGPLGGVSLNRLSLELARAQRNQVQIRVRLQQLHYFGGFNWCSKENQRNERRDRKVIKKTTLMTSCPTYPLAPSIPTLEMLLLVA